ncbi:MAG: class I mannose-6-phosphate isomerase [Chloroflexota bacterium]
MADLYPMLIEPRYVETLWGGHNLAHKLGKPAPAGKAVGESWEIYEENTVANGALAGQTIGALRVALGRDLMGHVPPDNLFPLLTKLIDAQQVLSVQVHPDDRFAREHEHKPYGKTECWYIIDVAPGATLTYGFSRDMTPDAYTRLVAEGALDGVLRPLAVRPGDVVYLPAGTVHAIGAGILLYEVQQTSDVTYRIYDWNRRDAAGKARELHVEQARQVLDYHRGTRGVVTPLEQPGSGRATLVAGQYFVLELFTAGGGPISTYDSPVAVCSLDRPVRARLAAGGEAVLLPPYSSLLVPAAAGHYLLEPHEGAGARAIVAYVPRSEESVRADLRARGFGDAESTAFLA